MGLKRQARLVRVFVGTGTASSFLILAALAPQTPASTGTTELNGFDDSSAVASGTTLLLEVAGDGAAELESEPAPPSPYDDVFTLHSRPQSERVIFLDFDGRPPLTGTIWNVEAHKDTVNVGAYDLDGDPSTFSQAEEDIVGTVWERVAEDFAPLDVDVTTEDPGVDGIRRSGPDDTHYGAAVVVTSSSELYDAFGTGVLGIANLGNFYATSAFFTPQAFLFPENVPHWRDLPAPLSVAASHEAGHTLGLDHDFEGPEHLPGALFQSIMSYDPHAPMATWSERSYSSQMDDFGAMAKMGLDVVPDDHPDAIRDDLPLMPGPVDGLIATREDVDVFSFVAPSSRSATIEISARPITAYGNLDIRLTLLRADGTVVDVADPPASAISADRAAGLSATIPVQRAGRYFVMVDGVGYGDPTMGGYSDYGSRGRYRVSLEVNGTPVSGEPQQRGLR